MVNMDLSLPDLSGFPFLVVPMKDCDPFSSELTMSRTQNLTSDLTARFSTCAARSVLTLADVQMSHGPLALSSSYPNSPTVFSVRAHEDINLGPGVWMSCGKYFLLLISA